MGKDSIYKCKLRVEFIFMVSFILFLIRKLLLEKQSKKPKYYTSFQ